MESWLSPMLCNAVDDVPEGDEWAIEGKLDGWRCAVYVRANGRVSVYGGRNGNSYTGQVPYIEKSVADNFPRDTALDGELIGGGNGNWNKVQSTMTSGSEHVPSKLSPALHFVVFDITRLDGEDMRSKPWQERRDKLDALWSPLGLAYVNLSPYAPSSLQAHEDFLNIGLEGSVCKRTDSRYVAGKSGLWVKVKPQTTCEARIVGFKAGKRGGQWENKVGAFEVELLENCARTTVKCGTDARHEDAHEHPENWLDKIIEIKHHGIQDSGVPKSPQFFRLRDDLAETRREAQVRRLLAEEAGVIPEPAKPKPRAPRAVPASGSGRRRNYGAMKDDKLLRCIRELESGVGDAVNRCHNGGSGDPVGDLAHARQLAHGRGLLQAAA
jgi:ATP-dependent DNA ligase